MKRRKEEKDLAISASYLDSSGAVSYPPQLLMWTRRPLAGHDCGEDKAELIAYISTTADAWKPSVSVRRKSSLIRDHLSVLLCLEDSCAATRVPFQALSLISTGAGSLGQA